MRPNDAGCAAAQKNRLARKAFSIFAVTPLWAPEPRSACSFDLALRASKVSNLKNKIASRRLGHTGPEDMSLVPTNVYSVDCDDVNNRYDKPKGHSYFRSGTRRGQPGKVFEHIFATLKSGRVYPDDEFRRTSIIKK